MFQTQGLIFQEDSCNKYRNSTMYGTPCYIRVWLCWNNNKRIYKIFVCFMFLLVYLKFQIFYTSISYKAFYCNYSVIILWCTRVYHTCRHMLYCSCSCYNCLPADEPPGSKLVEGIVKIIIKFNKGAFCWSTSDIPKLCSAKRLERKIK